jgi:hypothetical protein
MVSEKIWTRYLSDRDFSPGSLFRLESPFETLKSDFTYVLCTDRRYKSFRSLLVFTYQSHIRKSSRQCIRCHISKSYSLTRAVVW